MNNQKAVQFFLNQYNISEEQLNAISEILSLEELSDVNIKKISQDHPTEGASQINLTANISKKIGYDGIETYIKDALKKGHHVEIEVGTTFVRSYAITIDHSAKKGYVTMDVYIPKE